MRYIALGVNIGNLSRGPRAREPMEARCSRINRNLERKGADLRVVAFYRHTGNLVLETTRVEPAETARRLSDADCATWIAVTEETMRAAVDRVRKMPSPEKEAGVRWTPGLAFAVTKPSPTKIESVPKVRLRPIDSTTIAAWKRDQTTEAGQLDRERREGGWGGVSKVIGMQTNSQWTARSVTTLEGVLQRASDT